MNIPIASDHAGFPAKEIIKNILNDMGHTTTDYGTDSEESVDYADYAVKVAQRVNNGDDNLGILVCGSGQGVCMTANKFPKIRAGLVYNKTSAEMTRLHNDANILCLPGRELDENQLREILEIWLNTDFEGGRHKRRITKIESLTQDK